jgi:hypothetical protein
MFLRCHGRIKDGKEHRYWSAVENRRCGRRKVVQRQVLYLGEISREGRDRSNICKARTILEHSAACKSCSASLKPSDPHPASYPPKPFTPDNSHLTSPLVLFVKR